MERGVYQGRYLSGFGRPLRFDYPIRIGNREPGEWQQPHTHREMKKLAMKLAGSRESPNLALQFAVVEGFHANFYHRWKDDFQVQADAP